MEEKVEKSDVGVKFSQPFFDAETAADKDLLFSSSFPLLKEEATGVYNINGLPHTGQLVNIFSHDLKYYPFFTVLDDQGKMRLGTEWQVDSGGLYFSDTSPLFPPMGGSGNFRWTIYRLDVFSPFTSPVGTQDSTASGAYDANFGFKFASQDKSIDSTDLRDFTLHSRGRSPLVHTVDVKDWARGTDQVSHAVTPDFSYNPIAFAFVQPRGSSKAYNMLNGGQAAPRLTRSNKTITINSTGDSTQRSSIVVFKDPFLAPKTIQVTY
jgi:hypothetical protein